MKSEVTESSAACVGMRFSSRVDAKDEKEIFIQILVECYVLCSCFLREQPLESWHDTCMKCRK